MRLEELTAGTRISLTANINGEQLTFTTIVQDSYPKKHLILTDVVYQEEKIVTFHGPGVSVDLLVALEKDKPMLFEKVNIVAMKKADNSLCYGITCATESKAINRREIFRCYVGNPTTIKCGLNQTLYDGILRDVSVSGFAVTVDFDLGLQKDQVIHATLEDYIEELGENFSFHLYGLVVRIQPLDNGRIVYGCRMTTKIGGLENYVMKKERMRLRKTGGGGGGHKR